ncbi:MAG: hypothetical protein HRT72_05830 [Flavobacteriales bacterium]|nr:hypothetical protein [Flavobacteriales bacterium]
MTEEKTTAGKPVITSSKDFNLTTRDGKPIEVPHEGSMGILALGHVGLFAWRAKRKELGIFPFDKETQVKLKEAEVKRQEKLNKRKEK